MDMIKIADLVKSSYNPRKLPPEAAQRLSASLVRHSRYVGSEGLRLASTVTVNVNGNRIVGGHQRIDALIRLGQDWIHPDDITWVTLDPDSPEEKALNISLNNEFASGEWDQELLQPLLDEIKDSDGIFDELNLSDLLVNITKIDDIPESDLPNITDKKQAICPKCSHEFTP